MLQTKPMTQSCSKQPRFCKRRQRCEQNCLQPGVLNNAGLWSVGVIKVPASLRQGRVVTKPPPQEHGGSSSPPPLGCAGSKPTLLLQPGVGNKSCDLLQLG